MITKVTPVTWKGTLLPKLNWTPDVDKKVIKTIKTILSYPILSYPIQSYPILSYPYPTNDLSNEKYKLQIYP